MAKKLKTKMVAGMDSDGHFWAENAYDRDVMWGILSEDLQDGDYWANEGWSEDGELIEKHHVIDLPDNEWIDFISEHTQRGMMEFV